MRAKYRIAVVNEKTLGEMFHLRLSLWNLFLLFVSISLVTLLLFGLFIWFTPLRNYLPGNTQAIRGQLVQQTARLDSLQDVLHFQDEYLEVVKSVIAGDIAPDSAMNGSIDSMYIKSKQDLLSEGSVVIDEFMADYEARGKDNLSFFDQAVQHDNLPTLFRPASGAIVEHYSEQGFRGVRIQTPDNQHVDAVLSGTVVYASYSLQDGWTLTMQHDQGYLSICSRIERPLAKPGDAVRAGETIGLASGKYTLSFQLWRNGKAVDPESVINF